MGVSLRKDASDYFMRVLTSNTAADEPDEAEFLIKLKGYERGLCGGSELWSVAEPIAVAVLETAAETGRMRWLLRLCGNVMHRCVENPHDLDASTPAVLHLSELLLRHILRLTKGRSVELISVLEAVGRHSPSRPAASSSISVPPSEDTAGFLCRTAFSFFVNVPLDGTTVAIHLEVLRLLLTMTSSALHHGTDFQESTMDVFTELMMSSPQLEECLAVLLRTVVAWGTQSWPSPSSKSPMLYHESYQPSMRNFFQVIGGAMMGGIGPGGAGSAIEKISYVLDFPTVTTTTTVVDPSAAVGAATRSNSDGKPAACVVVSTAPKDPAAVLVNSCTCWEQLGRHAAALLCVLVVHQKGGGLNPALEYVAAMKNGDPVSFVRLLSAIQRRLMGFPEISILLYVLLHDHHDFMHTVLTEDAALFVSTMQQLLELTHKTCKANSRPMMLHSAVNTTDKSCDSSEDVLQSAVLGGIIFRHCVFSYPFVSFMSSTLLLLVSQDRVVNRLLCNTPCLPGHILERYHEKVPVGALAVVVLAQGITKGLAERNEALIAVFAPCLVNLAPFVHDMDSYTAQRISTLLTLVLKKIHRASALLMRSTAFAGGDKASEREKTRTLDVGYRSEGTEQSGSGSNAAPLTIVSTEDAKALEEIVAMYVRQLRTIVEAVESFLRGGDRHNEHLVYELLYARDRIVDEVDAAASESHPYAVTTKQLLSNLTEMITNCEIEIASSNQAESPQDIIAILRRGQRQHEGIEGPISGVANEGKSAGKREGIITSSSMSAAVTTVAEGMTSVLGSDGTLVDLVYSYEESPHSYDFFGPFVWATLLSAGRLPGGSLWCRQSNEVALFPW